MGNVSAFSLQIVPKNQPMSRGFKSTTHLPSHTDQALFHPLQSPTPTTYYSSFPAPVLPNPKTNFTQRHSRRLPLRQRPSNRPLPRPARPTTPQPDLRNRRLHILLDPPGKPLLLHPHPRPLRLHRLLARPLQVRPHAPRTGRLPRADRMERTQPLARRWPSREPSAGQVVRGRGRYWHEDGQDV